MFIKFLKKIFPLKVDSMEAFINTLQQGCKVLVEANTSEFSIRFSSVMSTGRKVVYRRFYCDACLPAWQHKKRRTKAIAILYPIVESKVNKLKESGVKVDLITS